MISLKISKHGLSYYLILFFILYFITPFFRWLIGAYIVFPLTIVVMTYLFHLIKGSIPINLVGLLGFSLIMFAIENVYRVLDGYETNLLITVFNVTLSLTPVVLGLLIMQEQESEEELGFLSKLIIVLLLITVITTIAGVAINPTISRDLASVSDSSSDFAQNAARTNVGGYSFAYMIVVAFPLIVYYLRYCTKGKSLWKIIIISVASLLCLLNQSYSISIILLVFSIVLLTITRWRKSAKSVLFITVMIFTFIIVFHDSIGRLLLSLASSVDNYGFRQRMLFIGNMFVGENYTLYEGFGRWNLYIKSFNTFLRSPFLGTFLSGEQYKMIDSFLLNSMARFGIVGLFIFIGWTRTVFQVFVAPLKSRPLYKYAVLSFVMIVLTYVLNNGISLFSFCTVLPIMDRYILNEKYDMKKYYNEIGRLHNEDC